MPNATISDVYAFLQTKRGASADKPAWIVESDEAGNNNGVCEKWEFYQYITGAWDGETTLSKDIISKFWDSIDTNKSYGSVNGSDAKDSGALNDNEIKAFKNTAELYQVANEFKTTLTAQCPDCITKNQQRLRPSTTQYSINWANGVKMDIEDIVNANKTLSTTELQTLLNSKQSDILVDNTAIQSEALLRALFTQDYGMDYKNYDFGSECDKEVQTAIDNAKNSFTAGTLDSLYTTIESIYKKYAKERMDYNWQVNVTNTNGNVSGNVFAIIRNGLNETADSVTYSGGNNDITVNSITGAVKGTYTGTEAMSLPVIATYTINGKEKTITYSISIPGITKENPETPESTNSNALDMSNLTYDGKSTAYTAPGVVADTKNFAELYNSEAVIELHTDYYGYQNADAATDAVKTAFKDLLDSIMNSLSSQLTDTTAREAAYDAVYSKYIDSFKIENATRDISDALVCHSYTGDDAMGDLVTRIQQNTDYGKDWTNSIVQGCNYSGLNHYSYAVSFTGLVDNIVNEYNKALGSTKGEDTSDNSIYTTSQLAKEILAGNNVAKNIQSLINSGNKGFTLNNHGSYYYFEYNGEGVRIEANDLTGVTGLEAYTANVESRTGKQISYSCKISNSQWRLNQNEIGFYTIKESDEISGKWDSSVEERIKTLILAEMDEKYGGTTTMLQFRAQPWPTWE